jgi:hypothetical protein
MEWILMIVDVMFEAIGKFLEDSFKRKSKTVWAILGLLLIMVLLIFLTC